MFISFEGVEGSGKTTLLHAVAERLRSAGRPCVSVREPGGTAAGDVIRRIFLEPGLQMEALTETLLVNASRAELLARVVRPALAAGTVVLCDRYVHSTLAYQGYGRELDLDVVRALCDLATGGLLPDRTVLVNVSLETSRARVARRASGADRIDAQDLLFHERVRSGYLALAAGDPRVVVVDGEARPDRVLDETMRALQVLVP